MNPIIKKQFEQIQASLDTLEDALRHQEETIRLQKSKTEEAVQRHWTQSRELAQLRGLADQTATLRERNAVLMARHEQMRERLQYLLEQTRVLTAETLQ